MPQPNPPKNNPNKKTPPAQPAKEKPDATPSVKLSAKPSIALNILRGILGSYLTYGILLIGMAYLGFRLPDILQKEELLGILKNGNPNFLCLSHDVLLYDESITKARKADDQGYIRFSKIIFVKDHLKKKIENFGFLAVVSDMNGGIYWSKMTKRETDELSNRYGVDYGTCKAGDSKNYSIPGAIAVTGN